MAGAALRRERPKELLRGAPFPFQYCWVHSCVLTLRPEEATPCREGAFPRRLAEKGFLKWPRILAVHLPPTWACLYLCVAGFHFNGSNLRMRQCHFYEVGVKKIYSLFQKAFFFFFPKEKGVESLRGFYGLHSSTLFAPLLCVISFFCLCWRTKPGWRRTWISPWSAPQWLGPLDLFLCTLFLHSLVSSKGVTFQGVDEEMFPV